MLYKDFLKTPRPCPFCTRDNRVIKENDKAFLTYSIAPYHKHHLMVIPKRHTEKFLDLTDEEMKDIKELLQTGAKIIKNLNYENYSILVRDGTQTNKSVPHLHFHIIPADIIGDLTHAGEERIVMTEEEINSLMKEIKEK